MVVMSFFLHSDGDDEENQLLGETRWEYSINAMQIRRNVNHFVLLLTEKLNARLLTWEMKIYLVNMMYCNCLFIVF